MKKQSPFNEIFKLPDLLEKFISLYSQLLLEMQKPIYQAIDEAKERVFEELDGKLCQDKLKDKFIRLFREIKEKAETCNNVATLQNIKLEADALKVRCLNEIINVEEKLTPIESVDNGEADINSAPITPIKKRKTISIKSVNNASSWQIETEEDVRKYIAELEKKLIESLEDDTIINVEF